MLFEYTYLLKDFDSDFFNNTNGYTREFIIPVNGATTGKKPALFQQLLNSKNQFCFYIPFQLTQYSDKVIKEEVIQNITRLLFLPNYMRIDGQYLFFYEAVEEENRKFDLFRTDFCRELEKQGIKEVILEILPTAPLTETQSGDQYISIINPEFNNYLSDINNAETSEAFIKNFIFPSNFYKKWIVPVDGWEDLTPKIKLIEKFENRILLTHAFHVQVIEMYKLAKSEGSALKAENKILKFKLENSAYYLKLIREQSVNFIEEVADLRREISRLTQQIINPATNYPTQVSHSLHDEELIHQLRKQIVAEQSRANEILAWYKKEYEVLPKWYKKFGHIIKVFMRKRTFKSLFE